MTLRVKKELFQWEKNRYVYVDSTGLAQNIFCVQFFNGKSKYGPEILVEEGKAKIPNYLLKECLPITALACFVEDGENQVLTRRTFKVLARPRPEHYIEDDDDNNDNDDNTDKEIIYDGGEEV